MFPSVNLGSIIWRKNVIPNPASYSEKILMKIRFILRIEMTRDNFIRILIIHSYNITGCLCKCISLIKGENHKRFLKNKFEPVLRELVVLVRENHDNIRPVLGRMCLINENRPDIRALSISWIISNSAKTSGIRPDICQDAYHDHPAVRLVKYTIRSDI